MIVNNFLLSIHWTALKTEEGPANWHDVEYLRGWPKLDIIWPDFPDLTEVDGRARTAEDDGRDRAFEVDGRNWAPEVDGRGWIEVDGPEGTETAAGTAAVAAEEVEQPKLSTCRSFKSGLTFDSTLWYICTVFISEAWVSNKSARSVWI